MAPNDDQLLLNTQTLQAIGSTIVSDTARLAADFQSSQQQFEAAFNQAGGKDTPGSSLVACLRQDFEDYEKQQTYDDLFQERQQIGEVLSKAVSLPDFQAQLKSKPFDIYGLNTYYNSGSENVPDHLVVPDDGFTLDTNAS